MRSKMGSAHDARSAFMRVLFVTLPEKGHLHPLLGPARELERAGHEVAWYAPRDVSAELRRAGFERSFAGAPFARFGGAARFRVCDCLSPLLTIAFTTDALTGAPPPGVTLAGPSLSRGPRGDEPAFPWERLDGRPLVYASLGSQIYWQPRIFATVLEAMRGRDAQLVIAAGELAGGARGAPRGGGGGGACAPRQPPRGAAAGRPHGG